jgi:hypothetical protein
MILSLASVTVLATDTEAPVREVRIYPSSEHPVFVLTDTEDVSYEWYVLPEGGARVTDTDATARAGAEYSDGAWHAGFNPETNEGNGINFVQIDENDMADAIWRAICIYKNKDTFSQIKKNAMSGDYSWRASAEKYLELYRSLV